MPGEGWLVERDVSLYTGTMKQNAGGRPPKLPEERYVRAPLSLPPDLWEEFKQLVPPRERSAAVAEALRREMRRRQRIARREGVPVAGNGAEAAREQKNADGAISEAPSAKPIWERILERAE